MGLSKLPEWLHCGETLYERGLLEFETDIPVTLIEELLGCRSDTSKFGFDMINLCEWVEDTHGVHLSKRGMSGKYYRVEALEAGDKTTRKIFKSGIRRIARACRFNQSQLEKHGVKMTQTQRLKRQRLQERNEFKLGLIGNASEIHKILTKEAIAKVADKAQNMKRLSAPGTDDNLPSVV